MKKKILSWMRKYLLKHDPGFIVTLQCDMQPIWDEFKAKSQEDQEGILKQHIGHQFGKELLKLGWIEVEHMGGGMYRTQLTVIKTIK